MPLDEAYLVWLYSQVGSVQSRNLAQTYWSLLRHLYKKEFYWVDQVPRDQNRAKDGTDLRREFLSQYNGGQVDSAFLNYGCSVLEMLVALSRKLAFEAEGEPQDWFWILINNLGLTECSDAYPPDEVILHIILDKFITRDYAPNGAGGLFPLQDSDEDQRLVELWYQAQSYLLARL